MSEPIATGFNLTRTDRIDVYIYAYGQYRIMISDFVNDMWCKQEI